MSVALGLPTRRWVLFDPGWHGIVEPELHEVGVNQLVGAQEIFELSSFPTRVDCLPR